jgi:dCTP deaminase
VILTGNEINDAVTRGTITIDPFERRFVNPNSYNYRLGPAVKVLERPILDALDAEHHSRDVEIPPDGLVLMPRRVYLGSTLETIGSDRYVPSLIGRSSLGRLGVFLQVSADLGHLGAVHKWTLEIVVAQPIRLYAGMRVGQVSFWQPQGDLVRYSGYFGRYSQPVESNPRLLGARR